MQAAAEPKAPISSSGSSRFESVPPHVSSKATLADRQFLLRQRLYRAGLVLALLPLFGLVWVTQSHLNVARDRLGLTRVAPLENAPPVLAFTTVALGGFRGIIANLLWLRATDLQEEDKYFEMVQLADWITKLQPHMVSVWVHEAWNMAYNISIKFTEPSDRWQWVRRGIELLRDQGLKYNPNEVLIYRELAWFFQHKMGADLDDAHYYYKWIWVQEMNKVFGRGKVNWDELLNPQTPEAKERVRLLREKFKMNPEWMKEVEDKYGPLEWHLPESSAIYWAYAALEKTDKRKLKKEEMITCRRVIFQSLQLAFRRGRLVYPNKNSDQFIYAPNLDIVPQTDKAYLEMMGQETTMYNNIANAHKNFLKWAVYYLYLYGRRTQANYWWKYMHEKYPDATPPNQDLEQYAFDRAQETVGETAHDDAKAMIEGFVRSGFISETMGEDDMATSYMNFAQKFRNRFEVAIGKSEKRVGLPPLAKIKQEVLNQLLDPKTGLDPEMAAELRTKLGLPAASAETASPNPSDASAAPATNAPPAAASPTSPKG
jgi:hypothetical protein